MLSSRWRSEKWFQSLTSVSLVKALVVGYNVVILVTTREGIDIMKTFAVCELEAHMSEILRVVEETGEAVELTRDGKVIAHLIPAHKPQLPFGRPEGDIWADMDRLAAEIDARWQGSTDAVDAVHDVRREL